MSISPPTTTTTTTTTTGTATASGDNTNFFVPRTYWCHECDMSVLLLAPVVPANPSSFPPLCPHCRRDFLEQMDSFTPPPDSAISGPYSPTFYEPTFSIDPDNPYPIPTAIDSDTFLLDSPYIQSLLVNNLMTTTTTVPTVNNDNNNNPINPPQYNSPASKSAIESLHHISVDSAFLQKDPTIVCPVCKDQFSIASQAKILPCKHTYHADCIVPWLEINNSCPVCRYRLPIEHDAKHEVRGGETLVGAARLDELLEDEQDLFGFRSILRNVVRRQQQNNADNEEHDRNIENWNRRVEWDNEVLFSPTQIGEAESGGSDRRGDHVERANSVETVTSWPRWPAEGVASGSGTGDGDIGAGVSSERGIGEGNPVRS